VRVIVSTINVNGNGIRAAMKRRSSENLGLLPWLEATAADAVCLQETSTTNWPPTVSPRGQALRGWSVRRPTRCAGLTAPVTVEYRG
jgi:exonuclease III